MATSGRGTGIVGYNVQAAVDTQHHMIVAHEITNVGQDRSQLTAMAKLARDAIGGGQLTVLADRGYFDGEEILRCADAGITALVPKPLTSNSRADGRFDKRDFIYVGERNEYRCPADERAIWRMTTVEDGRTMHRCWPSGLSTLLAQVAMHAQRLPPNRPLGTRAGTGRHAAPPGPYAASITIASADRGASLRHAEGMDGVESFPD
jgi:hypothetical protein